MSENNYSALMIKASVATSDDINAILMPGIYAVPAGNASSPDPMGGTLTLHAGNPVRRTFVSDASIHLTSTHEGSIWTPWDGPLSRKNPGADINEDGTIHEFAKNVGLSDTDNLALGDALIGVKSPLALAVGRTQHDKNAETTSLFDFGAIGDGTLHPLSERFTSLAIAQLGYPFVTSLTQSIDWAATQAALDTGKSVLIPEGVFVCNEELEMTSHGQHLYGAGRGYGYNSNQVRLENGVIVAKWSSAVFNWRHTSTLLFKGTGTKRIRTRVNYRASAADPQDAPLSVCLNIQAEGTSLEDFCVFLDVTPPATPAGEATDSIDNLGANWDVGIFVGCRQNTSFNRVGAIGYHRKANVWYDVTNAINLPRFTSWRTGEPYPQGPVENGADGCSLEGVFTSGGLWGVNVQGAQPKAGETTYSTDYYDEVLGTAVEDARGDWGFSDFLMLNSQIFGANHHTRRRLVDMKASPNAKTDWDVGGAFNIDGITKNVSNVFHGHRYIGTRFQSNAPFCVRIDRSARDCFVGCMIENPNFKVVTARDGSPLILSPATAFYGLCATDRHRFLTVTESQAPISTVHTTLHYGDSIWANSSESFPITRVPYGRLEVLAENASDKSVARFGTIDSPSAMEVWRSILGSAIISTNGSFVFQNVAGDLKLQVAPSGNTIFYGSAYPAQDNAFASGQPGARWTNVHAASSTIVTSDDRFKVDKYRIPDAVLRAWGKVNFMQYRLTDAVAMKSARGEEARIHFGVIAQDVKAAFESEGLDPFAYGVLCYDEWNDEYEAVIAKREEVRDGETVEVEYDTGEKRIIREAGNRYGIRYEEALILECAFLRWKLMN